MYAMVEVELSPAYSSLQAENHREHTPQSLLHGEYSLLLQHGASPHFFRLTRWSTFVER